MQGLALCSVMPGANEHPDWTRRAGLWEFPSLAADEGVSAAKRIAALDDYVTRLVRCWGLLRTSEHCTAAQSTGVLEELDAGELVHVFSHIRMTIRVRRVVVMAPVRQRCACCSLRQDGSQCL